MMAQQRFVIFECDMLSDAPGRCESWTEYLTFLGDDSWELTIEGTDFTGLQEAEPESQQNTTDELLSLLHDRDNDYEPSREIGPRLRALRAYAKREGLTPVVKKIERIRRGTWPPRPRVIRITGVTSFGDFPFNRGPRRIFLQIETTSGPCLMAVPQPGAKFVECWHGPIPFFSYTWCCRLRKELVAQAAAVLQDISTAPDSVPIMFLTAVVLVHAIASKYPEGLAGFEHQHPEARRSTHLRAVAFMSGGELDAFLVKMHSTGLTLGRHIGVGEMTHGEWVACPGIRFERHTSDFPPAWVAIYDPKEKQISPNSLDQECCNDDV
jgi:hypothetical protein